MTTGTLFDVEEKTIQTAQGIVSNEVNKESPLFDEYNHLFGRYKKLYKQLRRLIKMNDKQQNQLNLARKAADEATRAKGEFLANMSHEIRTPMNGIIGAAHLALEREMDPAIEKYLRIINNSANSLLGIINNILDVSKIEAGKIELEQAPFQVDTLLVEVTDLVASQALGKNIELLIDILPSVPKAFVGDAMRIKQVITNLLGNALKFTPDYGTIILGVIARHMTEEQGLLEFYIKDSGIGIKSEYLRRLFDPFSQADATTTRKYGGTGLGLTICKQLVELMQGEIKVVSEYGVGTTFLFTLPLDRQEIHFERPCYFPPALQGLTTLVIDNSVDSCNVMRKMLEDFGFTVNFASSGNEAIQMMTAMRDTPQAYDLIVSDWSMPKVDGIGISRYIRRYLDSKVPILLTVGLGSASEAEHADISGINAYLTKPIHPRALFQAIHKVFGHDADVVDLDNDRVPTLKDGDYKAQLTGIRLLVVEDNLTNQEVITAVLENVGIEVEIAGDGIEGIEALKKNDYDGVLMDVQMPKMDGYEATRYIRGELKMEAIPVIAMTAHALSGDDAKCRAAGMDGYITKPINHRTLFRSLFEILRDKGAFGKPRNMGVERKTAPDDLPAKAPGLNIGEAMKALGLNASEFKPILNGFLRNNQKLTDDFTGVFKQRDWPTLLTMAHTLKGSSANIHALRLYQSVFDLERACKNTEDGPPSLELLNAVIDALKEVLTTIEAL